MVLKRIFREGGEEGSEFPTRDLKRRFNFASALRDVTRTSPQQLEAILEPIIRTYVSEEVERTVNSFLRRSLNPIDASGSRILQLHFEDKLPSTLFTRCSVKSGDNKLVKIVLREACSKKIITSGPLSSINVNIVVLDGDFNPDDREEWTKRDFSDKTLREREGKRPLVIGTLLIPLREGVGYVENITFTDNSSWIRSGRFRLGAKVQNIHNEDSIREAITNAFKVKDHRGESYKKRHPPSPLDEVWRLEKIAKGGPSHERLASYGVHTVKDFLRLFVRDPHLLRNILGGRISCKAWNTIIGHATACILDNDELYMYKADGFVLVFNSVYQVVGAVFDRQNFLSLDMLNIPQKRSVEKLKQHVYDNLNDLVPLSGRSLDRVDMQMNSNQITISPTPAYGVENRAQFQVYGGETSKRMEEYNSILSSNFVFGDSCTGLHSGGCGWDTVGSLQLQPLLTDPIAVSENFQVETGLQGNGFLASPRNQAHGVVSSNLGIRTSNDGKPKTSWCKIRAFIKWLLVKKKIPKNGQAAFRF